MNRLMSLFNRFNSMSTPIKAAIAFMIASIFQQGLNIITTPIFTRILSTSDYGIINVYNSWLAIITVVATLSLNAGVFNVGMLEYKQDRNGFISSMLILSNFATLIIATIFLVFHDSIKVFLGLPKSLVILMFINLFFTPALNFWIARQRYEYKYKLSTSVIIISSVLSVCFSIFAVLNANSYLAEVRLWTSTFVMLTVSVVIYAFLLYKGRTFYSKKYWKFALSFNLPLLFHYLSFSVLSGSDRVMIANIVSTSAAGVYGLVFTASAIGNIVWNSINGSLIPYMHEKMETKMHKDIDTTSRLLLVVYAVFCLIVLLLAPELLKILAPPEYQEGLFIFPPVMAGLYFIAVYNVFANIVFYYKKTIMIMIISVLCAIINVYLNYLFIPQFGYISAAYTTLFSYILLAVMHYFNLLRIQKERIYNIKFIIIISFVFVCICMLCNILYLNVVFRYIIIFIVLLILLKLKNQILMSINIIRKK